MRSDGGREGWRGEKEKGRKERKGGLMRGKEGEGGKEKGNEGRRDELMRGGERVGRGEAGRVYQRG